MIQKLKILFGYNPVNSWDNKIEVGKFMNLLNYNERIAIILYYSHQYTTKEISQILKTSENNIKSRLRRAKKKIREDYERSENNGQNR